MSRTPKSTSSGHEGEQRARSKMTFSVLAHGVRIASSGYVSSSIAAFGIPISADIDLQEEKERRGMRKDLFKLYRAGQKDGP